MEIGEKIRIIRNKRGDSLRNLGKRLNIAHSHLSMIENGLKQPNLELLKAITKTYDVSLAFLVGDYTEKEKNLMAKVPQLTLDELTENYEIVVGDRPATKEEIAEMIKYVLIKREMDKKN